MRILSFSLVCVLSTVAAIAKGQEAAGELPPPSTSPPTAPPGYGPPAEPPAVTPLAPPMAELPGNERDVRFMDASMDRVGLFSTAETHPAGTFFFSDYELFLFQFGYAVTDNVQLALTGLLPLIKEQPYFFDLNAKVNFVRSRWFRLAGIVALDVLVDAGGADDLFFGGDSLPSASFASTRPARRA